MIIQVFPNKLLEQQVASEGLQGPPAFRVELQRTTGGSKKKEKYDSGRADPAGCSARCVQFVSGLLILGSEARCLPALVLMTTAGQRSSGAGKLPDSRCPR